MSSDFELLESEIKAAVMSAFTEDERDNINFTTDDEERDEATFPTVRIDTISLSEIGSDLKGETINAVDVGIQIDVITNVSQQSARKLAWQILKRLKVSRFRIIGLPLYLKQGDVFRYTLRASRKIGNGNSI